MLGSDPRPERVDGLVEFVEQNGGRIDTNVATALVAVIAALPEYQLC